MARNNWSPEQLGKVLARGHHTVAAMQAPGVAQAAPGVSKMGNHPTEYGGVRYDSKSEANYAAELDLKIKAGLVLHWERQIVFPLHVQGVLICKYILDFRVHYADGHTEHIDVKGRRAGNPYTLFKIKQRLMMVLYSIDVLERK